MKGKLSLDQDAIKQFFINHGEKVGFGVFALIAAVICYFAFQVERETRRPEDLKKLAAEANQRIANSTYPPPGEEPIQATDYPTLVAQRSANLDPSLYAIVDFNPQDFQPRVRRGMPKLFKPLEPRAASMYGAIAIGSGPGAQQMAGGDMAGPGAMPGGMAGPGAMPGGPGGMAGPGGMPGPGGMEKMMEQMGGKKGAKDKDKKKKKKTESEATPTPGGFQPASSTLPAGASVQGKQWVHIVALVPAAAQRQEYRKRFRYADGYDPARDTPQYESFQVERAEVDPANPNAEPVWQAIDVWAALDEMFNTWAGYGSDPVLEEFKQPELCQPLPLLVGKEFDDTVGHYPKIPFKRTLQEQQQRPTGQDAGDKKGRNPLKRGRGAASGDMPGQGRGMPGGPMSQADMQRGMPGRSGAPPQQGTQGGYASSRDNVEYRLFRFFDFTVQPGKTYRYRVRFELVNPNFGLPTQILERAEYAEQQFLLTEWSDPTEPVTVTRPSHLLAGSVKGTSASREAEATLLVLSWNAEKGVLATKKKEKIRRGAVANFASEDVLLSPPGSNKPEQAKVDLQTDSMLVDMFGGEKLPGTDVSPSEVLLLEADGQLAIQSQYTDAKAFYSELARLDKLSAAGPSSAPGGATSDFSDPFASMSAPPQGSSKKKSAKKN